MSNCRMSRIRSFTRYRFLTHGTAIALIVSTSLLHLMPSAQAAEKLIFTYGLFGRSITLSELEDFASTGNQTPTLKFFLKAAKQDPDQVRKTLTHEAKISPKLLDDLLYTLPGEYALFMTGKIFHTPTRRSNDKALRSAIILSAIDDRQISILEFLQNYPTQEFYIDGYRLAKTAGDVSKFINSVESDLQGPIAVLTDLFNGVVCQCESPPGPDSPINAN